MSITVIDSIMGSGKTQAAIEYINNMRGGERVMFVTPYLAEVERIIMSCPSQDIKQPKFIGSKLEGLRRLISGNYNIATTHELFKSFTPDIIQLLREYEYTLILDEVVDVVEQVGLQKQDTKAMCASFADIDEIGRVVWREEKYNKNGLYGKYMNMSHMKSLWVCSDNCLLFWVMPPDIFDAFENVYILTYMFDAQILCCYFKLHKIQYEVGSLCADALGKICFCKAKSGTSPPHQKIGEKIEIFQSEKLNQIGKSQHALSSSWYRNEKNKEAIIQLKKNCHNFFSYHCGTSSKQNMWTTFKEYYHTVGGKGYKKGFVVLNARATNDKSEKTACAYLVNRYPSPIIQTFFSSHKISISYDRYALSEMLQWLWRSAIRNDEKIKLYIPSSRMRKLLTDWIDTIDK